MVDAPSSLGERCVCSYGCLPIKGRAMPKGFGKDGNGEEFG